MIVKCSICEKEFEKETKRVNEALKNGWKLYCSDECRSHRGSTLCVCANCGEKIWKKNSEIKTSKSGNVFCNRSCATSFNNIMYKSKENHPNYKNGTGFQYRKDAFAKYEHRCLACGWNEDERVLEVHHIDENHNNNNIDNLCILCPTCHRKVTLGYYKLENNKLTKIK